MSQDERASIQDSNIPVNMAIFKMPHECMARGNKVKALKRNSTDRKMHREEITGERFSIPVFGTRLGAAYGSAPCGCVKAVERMTSVH